MLAPLLLRPDPPSGSSWRRPMRGLEGMLAAPLPPPGVGGRPLPAEDDVEEEPFHMDNNDPVLAERRPSIEEEVDISRLSCDWLREMGLEYGSDEPSDRRGDGGMLLVT